MGKLNKLTTAVAKALEVLHFLGAMTALAALLLSLFGKETLASWLLQGPQEWTVYGFCVEASQDGAGTMDLAAFRTLCIAALLSFLNMCMVFRNIYLILRTSEGKTWFAKGETPFQDDVVRMVREIGIFSISVPVLQLLISTVARLLLGVNSVEISVQLSGLMTGLVALCLSQIFAYGMALQNDVDGLV